MEKIIDEMRSQKQLELAFPSLARSGGLSGNCEITLEVDKKGAYDYENPNSYSAG